MKRALVVSAAGSVLLSVMDHEPARQPAAEPPLGTGPEQRPAPLPPPAPPPSEWPRLVLEDAQANPFAAADPAPAATKAAPVPSPPVPAAPVFTAAPGTAASETLALPPIAWLGRMVAPDGSRLTLLAGEGGAVAARVGENAGEAYVVKEVGERSVRLEHKASGRELIVSAVP